MNVLKAEHVYKRIRRKEILVDINLELCSGKIYGFVGRNGSGKTMLFRALSGLINIDSGKISFNEKTLHKDMEVLPNMGLTLENAGLYPELTGFQNLKILSQIRKVISDIDIKQSISKVGLNPDDKRSFRKYSMGMKQRLIIAQAIMEKPDIIILDEPTNALDEKGVIEVRNIIEKEKKRGAIILLASHTRQDIDILADHFYILNQGNIMEGSLFLI